MMNYSTELRLEYTLHLNHENASNPFSMVVVILGLLNKYMDVGIEWNVQVKRNPFYLCSVMFQSMFNENYILTKSGHWIH